MEPTIVVLSTLDGALEKEARRLWAVFAQEYGSRGVLSFAQPNLTFQGGQCSNVLSLSHDLTALCGRIAPYEVIVDGWGCFRTANVVFLEVVPSDTLRKVHLLVSDLLERHCRQLFERYLPGRWHPHIPVAMGDLSDQALQQASSDLESYHPQYRQVLSSLSLVEVTAASGHIDLVTSCALAASAQGS